MSRYADMDDRTDRPAVSRLTQALRSSPETFLLLGAAATLLAGGARRVVRAATQESGNFDAAAGARSITDGVSAAVGQASRHVSQAAGAVADRSLSSLGSLSEAASSYASSASSYASSASDFASSAADHVSDYAAAARRSVVAGSQWVENAIPVESTVSYLLREQPLLLVAAGFAAGAALGAALPSTEVEGKTFGGSRDQLANAASRAASEQLTRLRAARQAATDRLKEEAAERRLTPDGLKDLAHELAEAVKEGAKDPKHESSSKAATGKNSASRKTSAHKTPEDDNV